MDSATVAQGLRQYILGELLYASEGQRIGDHDDLLSGGILDSMGAARLASHMEELYRIRVDATDFTFENFNTLDSLAQLVLRKREASSQA